MIDLDKAANDLGWMKDVQQNMNSLKTQFETDLKNAKDTYVSQIMAKKTEFRPERDRQVDAGAAADFEPDGGGRKPELWSASASRLSATG